MTEEAKDILEKQRKAKPSEELVFPLPIQPVVDKHLKRWALAAGLTKPLSFRKARHTFAMIARRRGIPMHTIQGLLGHESEKMTQRYARIDELEKRKTVKKFPRLR